MRDEEIYWRNHRWSQDAEYTEAENVPLIVSFLEKYGLFWDGEKMYKYHGFKRYVIRWNDWRNNYRIPTEHPKRALDRKLQKKLFE